MTGYCCSHFNIPFVCAQIAGTYPLAEWGLMTESDVDEMCSVMEESLGVGLFKMLERFRDPADYRALLAAMFNGTSVHPNVTNLHSVAHEILQRRNWIWLLGHPGFTRHIHQDRSMHPFVVVWLWNGHSCVHPGLSCTMMEGVT